MNKREEQKEKRRWEILLAGLELFVKKGYTATKTSDIAKAVNMSDGLLFHYFPTKESLFEELICIGMQGSEEWMKTDADHPLAFFTEVVNQIFIMIRENPINAKFFVLMAQALRSESTPAQSLNILREQEQHYKKTVEVICAGQKTGEIRSGNPNALAWAFWCSIQGVAEQLAVHPETPFPKAEWMAAILKSDSQQKGTITDESN